MGCSDQMTRNELNAPLIGRRRAIAAAASLLTASLVMPQARAEAPLEQVVVSASRAGQSRFDAPAAIDVVKVDPFRATSPLVNLSG